MKLKETFKTKAAGLQGLLLGAIILSSSQVAAAQDKDLLYRDLPDPVIELAQQTVQMALETVVSGEERQWRNPEGIERGYVQPLRTFKNGLDQYCREYAEELHRQDGIYQRQRIACREESGLWRVVSDQPV